MHGRISSRTGKHLMFSLIFGTGGLLHCFVPDASLSKGHPAGGIILIGGRFRKLGERRIDR